MAKEPAQTEAKTGAPEANAAQTAAATEPGVRKLAKFTGHSGTRRIIPKSAQDTLIGLKGIAEHDLIWEPGNSTIDVTDVAPEVLEYLEKDDRIELRDREVPASN